MKSNLIKVMIAMLLLIVIIGCGATDENEWGIDHKSGIVLPTCNGDINTTTNAIELISGYTIEPLMEDTKIMLWHYSNSDKEACVKTGKAIMKDL